MLYTARYKQTTLLLYMCLGILAGLGLARLIQNVSVVSACLSCIAVLLSFRKKRLAALIAVMAFGLLLGLWRGEAYMHYVHAYDDLYDKKIVVRGVALSDGYYNKQGQLTFDMDNIQVDKPVRKSLIGKISVSGFGENAVNRGDVMQVEGKLRTTLGSSRGRMSFAAINTLGTSDTATERLRHGFAAGMESVVPEPEASFGLGLLIGQRSTLPDSIATQLSAVGLTHIIAVSGYNLTIIVQIVRRLFAKRSKYQSVVAAFILVSLFLMITGFSPSIVRAALVSGLSIGAWYHGRTIKPMLIIFLAAAITGLWNPLYPWSDVGWYLSFLAFFGVLIVAPLLQERFVRTQANGFVAIIIETVSAQIMTLPLIAFIFGQVSLVSLLANVLVVPLVPLAMVLALVAGLAGMLAPVMGGWLAWPAVNLLTYMLDIGTMLSRIPGALIAVRLHVVEMLTVYICIVTAAFTTKHAVKSKYGKITDIETVA